MKKVYKGKFVRTHCLDSHLDCVFYIIFYGISQIIRQAQWILERACFCLVFNLYCKKMPMRGQKKKRKCLLVHKNFCANGKFCTEIFEKPLLFKKVKEDRQENTKEQGIRELICSLYSYSFVTYITICNAIMLNFQAIFFPEKMKL